MDIFDLIGPIMVGPSSSHTAGAVRIGLVARRLLGEEPVRAELLLHGSFADTGRGHGTDRALIAGLLGMEPDEDGLQVVEAEVPIAEMQDFTTFLRQLTQGRGWFTFDFVRYETLPQMLEAKVIEQAKALGNFAEEEA